MKIQQSVAGMWFLAGALVLGMTGCSSVGYRTGDKTAASLQRASDAVDAQSEALDHSISALTTLVNSPSSDLKPPFKNYSASLERLVEAVDRTDVAIARLRETSAEYLAAWDAQLAAMNYEVIRSTSESRKLAVSNQVAFVCSRYEETQAVVRPFISYFMDIQRSLGTDLNAEGLAAARDVVRNAETNTQKVRSALQQLAADMNDSGTKLSSVIDTAAFANAGAAESPGEQASAGLAR